MNLITVSASLAAGWPLDMYKTIVDKLQLGMNFITTGNRRAHIW